jgi:hypothetical protein
MKGAAMIGAALAALFAGQAVAQVITIEPAQRTRIREYVVQERVRPVTIEEQVAVGATIPTEIELAPVPQTWGPGVARYRYVYTADHVVLVDPSTRRVVQIVE